MIHTKTIRKIGKIFVINIFIVILLLLILEGLSSIILLLYSGINRKPVAEKIHTEYDEQIGWRNIPNLYIQDMYGKGKYLKTNSQFFRNDKDFKMNVPEGKTRIICSGDSFTFGYGVDNDHTWCQQLISIDSRLETVNMGQGGYGIDQAYLWYKLNSSKLGHDIHIFTFITTDFHRMKSDSFLGYGKPVLSLKNNHLVVQNVPVPKPFFRLPYASIETIRKLNILRLLKKMWPMSFFDKHPPDSMEGNQIKAIILKIFENLQQINRSKNSKLVFVYLPMIDDYYWNISKPWREFLQIESNKNDWLFIDLIPAFRKLPPLKVTSLFIGKGELDYHFAEGHYNEKGNNFIAKNLYERLLAIPEISDVLQSVAF